MSTPTQRLIQYHIERLKDKNPDVRLKSINELALLGDLSTLDTLEQIFRTDPEQEVRNAARQAGLEIFNRNKKKPS